MSIALQSIQVWQGPILHGPVDRHLPMVRLLSFTEMHYVVSAIN